MNLNKVFILGRLTDNPQMRSTPTGHQVATFSIATNRIWTRKNDSQRQTDVQYHNIVVWDRQAEIASQFLNKGSLVLVEGRLQTRNWQDQQGQMRKTTEIICERMQLGPRTVSSTDGGGERRRTDAAAIPNDPETDNKNLPEIEIEEEVRPEDIPF